MKKIMILRMALALTVCSATVLATMNNTKKLKSCKSEVNIVQCEQSKNLEINFKKTVFNTQSKSTLESMSLEDFLKVYKSNKDN